jgi:MerR family transcriptional regulator, copper efflux regulator
MAATAAPARRPAHAAARADVPAPAVQRSKPRTIAVAAAEAGVGVETIRYYERAGLIPRPPRGAGYRHYSDETVERIQFIRHAARHGFRLSEIGELLGWVSNGTASCSDMCARMDAKIAELDERIAELSRLREHLASMVAVSPRRGAATNCKVMECFRGKEDCAKACSSKKH